MHVFESSVGLPTSSSSSSSRTSAHYKLTSTVMLYLSKPLVPAQDAGERKEEGEVALGGSMTRQVRPDVPPSRTLSGLSLTPFSLFLLLACLSALSLTLAVTSPPDPTAYTLPAAARGDGRTRPDLERDARPVAHRQPRAARRGHGGQDAQLARRGLFLECVRSAPLLRRRARPCGRADADQGGACVHAETSDILGTLRSQQGLDERSKHRALQGELVGLLNRRKPVAA